MFVYFGVVFPGSAPGPALAPPPYVGFVVNDGRAAGSIGGYDGCAVVQGNEGGGPIHATFAEGAGPGGGIFFRASSSFLIA